jgi:hypothetical protein
MACPICEKRKAKRFCPARAENICSVCCGTEREVTIDCPADCAYLVASREYDRARREVDWKTVPFSDVRIPRSFIEEHEPLLTGFTYAISQFALLNRPLVDSDVVAALQALAETYRTLTSGLYYEKPPEYSLQRELYEALKGALEAFKKRETERVGISSTRESEIRDALILLTQVGATHSNGRPKGRAFLDFLRSQVAEEAAAKQKSSLILMP